MYWITQNLGKCVLFFCFLALPFFGGHLAAEPSAVQDDAVVAHGGHGGGGGFHGGVGFHGGRGDFDRGDRWDRGDRNWGGYGYGWGGYGLGYGVSEFDAYPYYNNNSYDTYYPYYNDGSTIYYSY